MNWNSCSEQIQEAGSPQSARHSTEHLSPVLFWSCCLRRSNRETYFNVQTQVKITRKQLWPMRLQMMTVRDNLHKLMHRSGKKAHLCFFHHVSRQWKPLCQFYTTADTLLPSPLSSPVRHWLLLLCSISALDQSTLSAPPLSAPHRFALCNLSIFMILSLTCLLPPMLPDQSPVGLEVLKTISQSPTLLASFLSCLSLLFLSFSPPSLPLTFHSYPLLVLSLPLISPLPLPNHYQFSLTHYLLLAPRLPPPLPLIPPLSIPVSAYPPYISSAFALPSPHLQRHEYIIIYTMGPCLLFMNYQPCGQTKPIFIRNLHFISAPIRLGAKE